MKTRETTRRDFLKAMAFGAAALGMGGVGSARAQGVAQRPNIVIIMADDMGFSDIGCYGGEIQTPNLDRMAKQGLRFTQFYNAARCCPTRASLLTGLYAHQTGMGNMIRPGPPGPYQGYLNDRCVTIAEVLREAGYTTLMSGKWHVGEERPHWPCDRGFDEYFGLISGAANYFDLSPARNSGETRVMAKNSEPFVPAKDGFYMTDAFTDNALRMLDTYGRREKPFFLYLAYTAPHWPLHALPEDIAKYKGRYDKGWDSLREERHKRLVEMGIVKAKWELGRREDGKAKSDNSRRDDEATAWEKAPNKEEMAHKMEVYAAQIDRMDQDIGKVLAKIEELGKTENTLVLFLADNGGCDEGRPWGFDQSSKKGVPPGGADSFMSYGLSWANASNTPFRLYKKYGHEGGISTPLIAKWPAVIKKGGEKTDQVGHLIDFMATCCEAAGVAYPKKYRGKEIVPIEGKSLLPIFQGKTRDGHEAIYWEHAGNRALRKGDWKISSKAGKPWELYNMIEDRTEMHNLAEKFPDKLKELSDMWEA